MNPKFENLRAKILITPNFKDEKNVMMFMMTYHPFIIIIVKKISFLSLFDSFIDQLHQCFHNNHSVFVFFNPFTWITYLFRSAWLLYIVSSKENQENKPCKLTWIVGWYTNWKINESPFSSVCILFLTLLLKNLLYTRHHHSKSIYQRWWDFGFS